MIVTEWTNKFLNELFDCKLYTIEHLPSWQASPISHETGQNFGEVQQRIVAIWLGQWNPSIVQPELSEGGVWLHSTTTAADESKENLFFSKLFCRASRGSRSYKSWWQLPYTTSPRRLGKRTVPKMTRNGQNMHVSYTMKLSRQKTFAVFIQQQKLFISKGVIQVWIQVVKRKFRFSTSRSSWGVRYYLHLNWRS